MASRKENYNAQNTIKRIQDDIKLSDSTMQGLEATLVAHAFAGNMGDFTTMMTALGKTDSLSNLEAKIDKVAELVHKVNSNKVEKTQTVDPITQLNNNFKREMSILHKRISNIENKEGK